MEQSRSPKSLDAVRLLSNAIQKIHYFDFHDQAEAMSPPCESIGELILQDALEHLAWGDTDAARELIDLYEQWERTGEAPWPFDRIKPSPSEMRRSDELGELTEDPGGGVRRKDDFDDDIPF